MNRQPELAYEQRDMRSVFIKCIPPSIDSAVYPVLFHGIGLVVTGVRTGIKSKLAADSTHSDT